MYTWHTHSDPNDALQILEFGYDPVGLNNKWGPGRRNFYILHYVLDGKGYFNGTCIKKGQGFLITPMMSVEYHPDPAEPWNYFWICFNGKVGQELCQEYINADESGIFDFNFQIALKQTLGELYNREPTLGNMYALSLFYKILSNHEQSKVLKNPYVEEAVWYMHMNYHKPLTVTQVADVCGINDRYMYNLFMRHLGISPKQYLNNLRLKNAAHILKNSDCTITEAAYSVGFTDVLTFSRFFSKHMEVSPRAYRKRRKSEVLN
ncbi:MAG: helix-turn-helix domain-containing protein [Ruminococcaceae bacterium]|nr:helix-turn-helix domain-containing protein [Oscillospiraceae bacterium]